MVWNIIELDMLKHLELFETVSEQALTEVAPLVRLRHYQRGQRIFENGMHGGDLLLLLDGQVRLSRDVPGMDSDVLAVLERGHCFGETSMMLESGRTADAWAMTDCRVGLINNDELKQLMDHDFEFAEDILWVFVKTLSGRIRASNTRMAQLIED